MTAVMTRARDGLLVVSGGEVVVANHALCRLLGADPLGGPAPAWVPEGDDAEAEVVLPGSERRLIVTVAAWPGGRVVVVRSGREAELARLADRDPLTGLLNRRAFTARLHEETARGRRTGLIAIDLDHFKAVNDAHGHPMGDRVLAEAAARIAEQARAIDSVARVGGEEFAWLLPDAGPEETLAAAERLRRAIRSRPLAGGHRITASIGVCDSGRPDALVERADRALYWAKACGRDAVLRWTPETADRIERARAVAGAREAGPAGAACAVAALAAIADELDPGHARRVADLAVALAAGADWPPTRQARLHQAALLHDLGAIARPSDHARIGAELAAAVLDAEQRDWIRRHREPGAGVLDGAALLGIADDHLSGRELDPAAAGRVGEALAWWA